MSAIPAKKMLETLLKTGTLSAKEREVFEGMYDAVHRYGKLSGRQVAWIEEVYYKKDMTKTVRSAPVRSPKMGFIIDPSVAKTIRMRDIASVKLLCPHILPESKQFQAISNFFKSGGEVFEVRPS